MRESIDEEDLIPRATVGPTQASPKGAARHEARPIPTRRPARIVAKTQKAAEPPSDASSARRAADRANISRVMAVVNRKGGVGKTTTTFNLAGALAKLGHEVLVIDLDPMGSLCRSLRIYPGDLTLSDLLIGTDGSLGKLIRATAIPNLYVIPGDPNLRTFEMMHATSVVYREALQQRLGEVLKWKPFPFVLIDCPPSLGLISGNALGAAGEVIIPVDGSTYGMGALMDTLGVLRLVRKNVNQRLSVCGLLLNNMNLGTVYDRTVLEVFKHRMRSLLFGAVIPTSSEADESSQMGDPVVNYAPASWMAKGYLRLAQEVIAREPARAN